jgi:predicted ATPase with chaperone activity
LEKQLVEILTEPGITFCISGLAEGRARSTEDRVRAALVNTVLPEVPPVSIRLDPAVTSAGASDLDLAIAMAILLHVRLIGTDARWVLASGRLGLDGTVHSAELEVRFTLTDLARRFDAIVTD